jgi:hypothetical protein
VTNAGAVESVYIGKFKNNMFDDVNAKMVVQGKY